METPKFEGRENKKSVEETANYEGSHTLVLCERLQNPKVRDMLIDNLQEHINTSSHEYFRKQFATTKEEISTLIDERIKSALHSTDIVYFELGKNMSLGRHERDELLNKFRVEMCIGYKELITDKTYSTQGYNSAESHEKGHHIRYFDHDADSEFQRRLLSAFDVSKIQVDPAHLEKLKEMTNNYLPEPMTEDRLKLLHEIRHPTKTLEWVRNLYKNQLEPKRKEYTDEDILRNNRSYHSDPNELIERMSQLKNYFGMSGTETFTKEHLDHSRKHFKQDTGVDALDPFFSMITPEKEEKFIELMNTLGI